MPTNGIRADSSNRNETIEALRRSAADTLHLTVDDCLDSTRVTTDHRDGSLAVPFLLLVCLKVAPRKRLTIHGHLQPRALDGLDLERHPSDGRRSGRSR